jgi:hypothetical protein
VRLPSGVDLCSLLDAALPTMHEGVQDTHSEQHQRVECHVLRIHLASPIHDQPRVAHLDRAQEERPARFAPDPVEHRAPVRTAFGGAVQRCASVRRFASKSSSGM